VKKYASCLTIDSQDGTTVFIIAAFCPPPCTKMQKVQRKFHLPTNWNMTESRHTKASY